MTDAADTRLRQRLLQLPESWEPGSMRRAAVLAPIVERDGEDWLVCIVRPAGMREHAGQIAFPGGAEDGDRDPSACALREACEEIGLPAEAVTLLGSVPSRQSSSGYRVHCLVGRIRSDVELVAAPNEVARILLLPWKELADPSRWRLRQPTADAHGKPLLPSPHFEYGDDVLWGLTGRFTFELIGLGSSDRS